MNFRICTKFGEKLYFENMIEIALNFCKYLHNFCLEFVDLMFRSQQYSRIDGIGQERFADFSHKAKEEGAELVEAKATAGLSRMVPMGFRHKHNPCHFSELTSMTQKVALIDMPHREILSNLVTWAFPQTPPNRKKALVLPMWADGTTGCQHDGPSETVGRAHLPCQTLLYLPGGSLLMLLGEELTFIMQSEKRLHMPVSKDCQAEFP